MRRGGGQVEDDPTDGDDDMHAEFEQSFSQAADLGAGTRRARGAQAEFLQQDVGGGGEEHAELIGPKARAARAPDLEIVVELFDPILHVPARRVDLFKDEAGRLPQVRDQEARIATRGRPAKRTTSALIATRRSCAQEPAA
jgi:hypothetical protein